MSLFNAIPAWGFAATAIVLFAIAIVYMVRGIIHADYSAGELAAELRQCYLTLDALAAKAQLFTWRCIKVVTVLLLLVWLLKQLV